MFERKMDNCKPCGGAIPLCMIDEFKLPEKIVDRKVISLFLRTIAAPQFLHYMLKNCGDCMQIHKALKLQM